MRLMYFLHYTTFIFTDADPDNAIILVLTNLENKNRGQCRFK